MNQFMPGSGHQTFDGVDAVSPDAGAHADQAHVPSATVQRARTAGVAWAETALRQRVALLRRIRYAIVERAGQLATALADRNGRRLADTVAAEVMPVVDAVRFLERRLPTLLAPARCGRRGRPAWLVGSALTIHREPLGVILVIGPSNYPLFLPAVHALQAIAAGNAVLVKPAPGCERVLALLSTLLASAGLPADVLTVLPPDVASAHEAIPHVDHVVFTGSAAAGRDVLQRASTHLVPVTLELSGHDAVFVLPGADLDAAAKAMRFGLTFNGSATCIAPRRVFVPRDMTVALGDSLHEALGGATAFPVASGAALRVRALALNAVELGARVLCGSVPAEDATHLSPLVLGDVPPQARVLREEAFAPLLAVTSVESPDEALMLAAHCPMALGATVFGPPAAAQAFAQRVNAGCVVVNDCIVPTADPRLPFGGRGDSGYGVTRGAEGLLAMTRVKAVAVRKGTVRPHYDPPRATDVDLFTNYLCAAHGQGIRSRLRAAARLLTLIVKRSKGSNQ